MCWARQGSCRHRAAASATIVAGAGFALISVTPLWFDFLPLNLTIGAAVGWLLVWMLLAAVQAARAAQRRETPTEVEPTTPPARPSSRLVTLIVLGLLAGCSGIYATTVLQASHTVAVAPGHYDQLAVADLTDTVTGNYDAVESGLAPAVAKQLPATVLAQGWQSYQQLFGSYQSHGRPEDVTSDGFTVVNVPLTMADQPGQFRISFDRSGCVAGLYFLRTGIAVP